MAQQLINLGATGSGAGGDSARTAFEKIIANFAELYLLKAPLDSPVFTGNPTAPTPATTDNDTSVATTAFVRAAMALFGVGGAGPRVADLNSQMTSGLFTCDTSTLNRPASDSAGAASCLVSAHDADDVRQVYFFRDGRIATRVMAAGTWSAWQELWHTGNLAKQNGATDTTPGALMAVGAFGLGASFFSGAAYITDADALTVTGDYPVGATWVGSPFTGTNGINQGSIRHTANFQNTSYAKQEWTSLTLTTPRKMVRNKVAGTWGPWREVFHTGNILGTVSQSGGVPTGAIIERGSNANGEYVRFADGTQICTGSVTLQPQAISTAQQIVVPLAAGFANTSYRVCNASETNPAGDQSGIGALNYNGLYLHKAQTAITFSSYAYREPLPAAVTLSFIAFGRWY